MNSGFSLLARLCVWSGLSLAPVVAGPANFDPIDCVDPLIGIEGGGNLLPGPCLPFSLVRLGPDTLAAPPSGYRGGQPVLGFSHNHLSGTGGDGRLCNIRVTPQVGPLELSDLGSPISQERAEASYYSVMLDRSGVRAELTSSERCGVHRYTFPAGTTARVLIDASSTWVNTSPKGGATRCTAAEARIVSDRTVEGSGTYQGGWGNATPHTVYFVADFGQAFAEHGTWSDKTALPGSKSVQGTKCGVYLEFPRAEDSVVTLRVGLSYVSLAKARQNLAQTAGLSFDEVKTRGQTIWREHLRRIEVDGGTADQRRLFYTSLYRALTMPTDVTGENPRWESNEPHYWDFYAFWDTFRCTHPLYTLAYPERETAIVRCLLDIYRHRGWLPDAWIVGNFASIQGGTNGDVVVADAVIKGLRGFDTRLAYEAVKKDASVPSEEWKRFGRPKDYFERGYLACESLTKLNTPTTPTSRTLEYSLNDFAVGQVARALGLMEEARRFERQSLNGFNLFHPEKKFFWAKDRAGEWLGGFSATLSSASWCGPFYEGTTWHYAFAMPHDVQGLINRHGGSASFLAFLDRFFDGGFYVQGNEPDILSPWLYTYVGRPDKNVDRVRAILAQAYQPTRRGWPGNDDAGAMSAWYVFGSMGFYPNAGQDVYLLASPVFESVNVRLDGGKVLRLVAHGLSAENKYIRSATLNGKPWTKAWFRHSDIAAGAEFVFEMGATPSDWGTQAERPPSLSQAAP